MDCPILLLNDFSIEKKSKVLPTTTFPVCPMALIEYARFAHSDPLINQTRRAQLEAVTYKKMNIPLDSSPLTVAVTWVKLLHIWHVQDSDLCPQSGVFRLRFFRLFLQSLHANIVYCLKLGHDRFRPHYL